VLVRRGNTLLHYVRGKGSGEKRLVAKGSIGIGGHINHRDEDLFGVGFDYYEEAVQRELHEELLIDADLTWLAIVAVIMAAVSSFYYLRVVWYLFFREQEEEPPLPVAATAGTSAAVVVTALGVLLVGLYPSWLLNAAQSALQVVLGG